MEDITGPEVVEISIREDGEVLWVNTEEGCVLRICRIKRLVIVDRRREMKNKLRKKRQLKKE